MAKNLVKYSVVNAFTESPFKGNPAAVCFLEEDRDDQWLLLVAAEFNTPVTCYLSRITESEDPDSPNRSLIFPRYRIRWFTAITEVDICGHATMAAAHTLFTSGNIESDIIEFVTLFGILTAKRVPENNKASDGSDTKNGHEAQIGFLIELNFPADPNTEFDSAPEETLVSKALGGASVVTIRKTTTLDNLIVVLPSAKSVAELRPDFGAVAKCPGRGITVTGIAPPESGFDFHSRYFAPKLGVDEGPVCGSAHCGLAPYWSENLGKCDFVAYQASPRGGVLNIHLDAQNQRVLLRGKACTVMDGALLV